MVRGNPVKARNPSVQNFPFGSHVARLIELSEDLPIVIEIVDSDEKIGSFLPVANDLFEKCGRGGLITVETVDVLYYKPKKITEA